MHDSSMVIVRSMFDDNGFQDKIQSQEFSYNFRPGRFSLSLQPVKNIDSFNIAFEYVMMPMPSSAVFSDRYMK
jgi:hypothetical protein